MCAKTKETIRNIGIHKSLNDVVDQLNPILRGWINYYEKYHKTALCQVIRHVKYESRDSRTVLEANRKVPLAD